MTQSEKLFFAARCLFCNSKIARVFICGRFLYSPTWVYAVINYTQQTQTFLSFIEEILFVFPFLVESNVHSYKSTECNSEKHFIFQNLHRMMRINIEIVTESTTIFISLSNNFTKSIFWSYSINISILEQ